jgi:hypothetical protein
MESQWFDGLQERSQGFLLASMLFSKRDFENLVAFLDDNDSAALRPRAESISSLERSQRVRLLVGQLKKTLYRSSPDWISAVHPSWLAAFLREETPIVQDVALACLPANVARVVAQGLGVEFSVKDVRAYPETILKVVRRKLESRLVPMRSVRLGTVFSADLLLMLSKEELAKAVNQAGLQCFAAFLQKESVSVQKEVVQRLEYDVAQKIMSYIESGVDGNSDLYFVLNKMAENGLIDERFSKCLRL